MGHESWSRSRASGRWPWVRARRGRLGFRAAVLVFACVVVAALMCGERTPQPPSFADPAAHVRSAVEVHVPTDARRQWVLGLAEDVWSESTAAPSFVVVLDQVNLARVRRAGLPAQVVVEDIDAVAQLEQERLRRGVDRFASDWFAEYKDVSAVDAHVDELAWFHPRLSQVHELGLSVEGRPIRALKIGTNDTRGAIVINGGQHAREWISIMVTTCIADRLLTRYEDDPRVRKVVDDNTFYIVPMANPDGYQYSWDKDRYWRKNRRGGYGVDLNRNYAVAFGGPGSSRNRRSQIYRGEGPLSEPESQALGALFAREHVRAHLDLHSFGQLVLHPWSHKKGKAPRHDELAALADNMVSAMYAAHETRYRLLPAEKLYAASGTLMDWVYGTYGALSYVVELRPQRGRGFVLPPEEIVPTCDETFAAVLEVAQWSEDRDSAR